MIKQKRVQNVPDFKDGSGNYVVSYCPEPYVRIKRGKTWRDVE